MPEPMQRRLIMLFCHRRRHGLQPVNEAELAVFMRINEGDLKDTKKLFIEKSFIDDKWQLRNWAKRQSRSDISTSRTRAFRKNRGKKKMATEAFPKRFRNVPGTV